jgi:thiamine transport system substrate-binding protein
MNQNQQMHRNHCYTRKSVALALIALASVSVAGCAGQQTVILATHDSFAISDELVAQFEQQSGYQLEIVKMGDTGSLVSRLALTVSAPVADVYYGIDNSFLARAQGVGLIGEEPTAINFGDVCFNYDLKWFESNEILPPDHWDQLATPEFAPLAVITDPRISSPGKAFLLSTEQYFESQSQLESFWTDLQSNGVRIAASWEDAYFLDFTRYGGDRPIVLSYASSPAAEVDDEGKAQTVAMRADCFRQIEFAGVLPNAANSSGAKALVEFMQSESFQSQLPELMFVYPVSETVQLDDRWRSVAPPATSFFTVTEGADDSSLIGLWERVFGR